MASFGDPYPVQLAAHYASIQRSLWALDLTHDLGIPVFVAVSRRIDKPAQDICFGFGAHLDVRIALERPMTEMNQFLPGVILASAEHLDRYAGDAEMIRWWKTATVEREPYLSSNASAPPRRLADFPRLGSGDLREDILSCVRVLEERGLHAYALDQSRPDTGLHVTRVIVPSLRHFWPASHRVGFTTCPSSSGGFAVRSARTSSTPRPCSSDPENVCCMVTESLMPTLT